MSHTLYAIVAVTSDIRRNFLSLEFNYRAVVVRELQDFNPHPQE